MDSFWAKKDDKSGQLKWISLSDHLKDTCEVAKKLWDLWLDEGQRAMIIRSISPSSEELARATLIFLAATHDEGKASPAFQAMGFFHRPSDIDQALVDRLEREGYIDLSHLYLSEPHKVHHSEAGQVLLLEMGIGEDLALIVGGHHGRPSNHIEPSLINSYSANFYQEENEKSVIHQRWKRAQEKIIEEALRTSGFSSIQDLPTVDVRGQVLLSGLVIMADWIASNEEYFPLYPFDDKEAPDGETRRSRGFEKWASNQSRWRAEKFGDLVSLYQSRFGFAPRKAQEEMNRVIDQIQEPGILIFEAPMGMGKTEASLIACEQIAAKTHASGLFFGLPTQATSNGIYPRIKAWMDKLDPDNQFFPRLQHGKAALNPLYDRVSHGIDIDGEGSIPTNQWFSGRKTASLDSFVIGTVDQLLLLALKQKHLALRHLGMSKKVVIVDEVHAYDAYMNQYLATALRWLAFYGIPVILLSATLPIETRNQLLAAYLSGKGCRRREIKGMFRPDLEEAYPLLTYSDGKELHYFADFSPDTANNKRVDMRKLDEEDLMELLEDCLATEGVAGVVVNTVKRAQQFAQECIERFSSDQVLLLHSAFIASDRAKKENQLLSMLQRGGDRPKGMIVIGSQVIEQSLDIDLDSLFTDLAPMDLLIQRIGRLHRHKETKRPKKYEEAICYVMGSNDQLDFEPGSSAVYGDYLLGQTLYYLPAQLSMPEDISPLVQKVYGAPALFSDKERQEKHQKARTQYEEKKNQKKARAENFLLGRPQGMQTIEGWLVNSPAIDSEERGYAQVRDSDERVEVIALQRKQGGYGFFEGEEDLSEKIGDTRVAQDIAKHTITLPNTLSRPYIIDRTIDELERFTLKNLPNWQESSWLKGALGIVFDEGGWFELFNFRLHYDSTFGLTLERMEDGKI